MIARMGQSACRTILLCQLLAESLRKRSSLGIRRDFVRVKRLVAPRVLLVTQDRCIASAVTHHTDGQNIASRASMGFLDNPGFASNTLLVPLALHHLYFAFAPPLYVELLHRCCTAAACFAPAPHPNTAHHRASVPFHAAGSLGFLPGISAPGYDLL